MTKFKVGDRVRLTGDAWRNHGLIGEVHVVENIVGGLAHIAAFGRGFAIYRDAMDYSATLVEHAPPPPDTRKRLREYTDIENGDTVVIGGVALTMTGGYLTNEKGSQMSTGYAIIQDMLVDEVRRKPRTKKRRVYEEVDVKSALRGDIVVTSNGDRYTYYSSGDVADGEYVLRLVEETEVPR
jgi:hypothetical protein